MKTLNLKLFVLGSLSLWLASLSALPARAIVLTDGSTVPVDLASPMSDPTPGVLATTGVPLDAEEKTCFDKLEPAERTTGSLLAAYSLAGKTGKYVSWFGIVRKAESDSKTNETVLTVEQKFSDGLTDTHILTVSIHGAGDFQTRAKGSQLPIMPLRLVRVYGTVTAYKGEVPVVSADFIKEWDWGNFNFMDYGTDKGNPEWAKLIKVPEKKIYTAFPGPDYYRERLGEAPTRIYEILSDKQKRAYAESFDASYSKEAPMARALVAPKYMGKRARVTSRLSKSMPLVLGFRHPEEYLDFRAGGERAKSVMDKKDLCGIEPETSVQIVSYKLFDESVIAIYEVKPEAGQFKDESWWLPGFALEPLPGKN
jgi:hypothetical protein